jgi:hypothetical protein
MSDESKIERLTPDRRYVIVDGRLWRASNPDLSAAQRHDLVTELMSARRAVYAAQKARNLKAVQDARRRVDAAKVGLGERGPVWWNDGAPDLNRRMVGNTPYAAWYARRAKDTSHR